MKKSKRILSLLLSVIMILSIIPAGTLTASAASYMFPVLGQYSISRGYTSSHLGVDITSSQSSPKIVSTMAGRVEKVANVCSCTGKNGWFNGWRVTCTIHKNTYGNMVIIINDDGTRAVYGHLRYNSITVKVGDRVQQGQVIGIMGQSGCSTGVHLHFEIRTGSTKSTCKNMNNITYTAAAEKEPSTTKIEYKTGTYVCTESLGVRIRKNASIYSDVLGLIPNDTYVNVIKVNSNWGYITYNGVSGWTCLDYYQFKSVPVPSVPSLRIDSNNIAVGGAVTVSWNAVSNVNYYQLKITAPNGKTTTENMGTKTTWSKNLSETGKYTFTVSAYNIENKSNGSSSAVNCTTHKPSTVKFVDWDGAELKTVEVGYGKSTTAPESPSRKGYSFQGWDGSYYNITSDRTITALYKVNTYTVKFLDKSGKTIGLPQKVNFGESAVEPENVNIPDGYTFLGWNSDAWQNVYTDDPSKVINISGIYQWGNDDLPIVCANISAIRQSDGYYVYFNLTNYDKAITRGRAVVSLKTASGKLVEMTESTAFSIAKDSTKANIEVFVPCDEPATKAEVIIVNSYSSGVPISKSVETLIVGATDWSEWSTIAPENDNGTLEIETKTQYRYRDKEFSTGNAKSKSDWTYIGVDSTRTSSGTSSSAISDFVTDAQVRKVTSRSVITGYNQKTQYRYSHYVSGGTSRPTAANGFTKHTTDWSDNNKTIRNWLSLNGVSYARYGDNSSYWGWCNACGRSYFPFYNEEKKSVNTTPIYGTVYDYVDTFYTYKFYRWKEWSEWLDDVFTANDNREVDTRTVYRYKSNNASVENETGVVRTVSGNLSSELAGKQITLYVYGYTGASDYTNQYIGQSVIGDDGSYSFEYKLRQEPTEKTGDYTIAIGIEGSSNTIEIDKIEAPKPTYVVNFYDYFGNIISAQEVVEGENAVVPDVDEIEGYDFIGWDKSNINIKEDTDIYADYEKKEFTIVFVDWENQFIELRTFKYGDVIETPDFTEKEGYDFVGWDEIENGNVLATRDMVITAQYEKETYSVKFYDYDGNVIDEQEIKYGEAAKYPDIDKEGVIFAGWFNPENYQNVTEDVNIYPSYYFEETTENPTANYGTGEYTETLELTLTSSDENAVIYYYLNDDATTETIYTGPITVDKTCSITYYAESLGKNRSDYTTNHYCINGDGVFSDWMLYDKLPENIKDNPDDYVFESETGFRFRDVENTTSVATRDSLLANGWDLTGVTETVYTDWQDEELSMDETLIDYVVETQVVEDVTKTNYKYSHYKYTDENGEVQYSPVVVEGFDCEEESIVLEERLVPAGFLEDNTTYYEYDSHRWFKQTKVNGNKTQYRGVYEKVELYKWTEWDIVEPAEGETRNYESVNLYRYSNKNYHIIELKNEVLCGNMFQTLLVEEGTFIDVSCIENFEGHNFFGLYTDAEMTTVWDKSTPVTESVTLYAKYEPKVYTVVFQMQDGTEIDTQKVVYMNSATAPATDAVPGYVFAGWDKDFTEITADTVITGKYFKESEYARVTLNNTKAKLYVGSNITLTATITPSNLVDEAVEWTTSDSSVAVVDDKGNVTAVGAGTAEITVTVLKTKEKATCVVTVNNNSATNIVIGANSSLNYDSLGYLRRIVDETSISSARGNFENTDLIFTDIKGNILDDSAFVGTGTVITLKSGDNVLDAKTCIITGDMNGDGMINNRDVSLLCRYLVDKETPTECQILAMDANGDGSVNNKDAALLARYLVGKATL